MNNRKFTTQYTILLIPGLVLLFTFRLLPIFGNVMAFQDYVPARGMFGSRWVGLENIRFMFEIPDSAQVFINTLVIAGGKIVANIVVPVLFALMLHEVTNQFFKRTFQTLIYLPHFLSWVILGGILTTFLSSGGPVNTAYTAVTANEPIKFLGNNDTFRLLLIGSNTWKEFGFNTIVYLAALTAIDPNLYESADIDGARRLQKVAHITLPSITPTVVLVSTLALGKILEAGFEQVFNLYNPVVYDKGDIVDTYVYRVGLLQFQYSLAAAVGLLKSAAGFILISVSYFLANRFANYRIF